MEHIERTIGYKFNDRMLLQQALTHKSYSNEQPQFISHNERLEFLGDAVLELAVSDLVYNHYPDIPEGGLTRIRAEVVSEKGLAEIARQLEIGAGMLLGRGERKSGGNEKSSLLADTLEALLGAIFCDQGFLVVSRVIGNIFSDAIEKSAQIRYGSDYKTCLQERLQAKYGELPEYLLAQVSGPDHQRIFSMEVYYANKLIGKGSGSSKKSAEQKAAAAALDHPLLREK
ncbi:MAG: ribonuclease III [Desulfuromonadales bacterium]|nr:ribonuclease III [Desulfuromonadales bacterium]